MDDHNASDVFVAVAREYCTVIERAEDLDWSEFARRVAALLAQLYYRALDLPSMTATDTTWSESMSDEQYVRITAGVARVLGERQRHWLVYDPIDSRDHSVVATTLADDLADIYRDLAEGLRRHDATGAMEDAVWEWRSTFWSHWGFHLVDALRALHSIQADASEDE